MQVSSNNKKISVVCCAFNAEKYLISSLDSLLLQSFDDFELILVDDGSSDDTQKILLDYKGKFKNCRLLVNSQNQGIPVSRNRALLSATGEYIAIHDADDISHPSRLERENTFLDEHPECFVVGSYAIKIDHSGNNIGSMVYPPQYTRDAFAIISRFKLNPIIDPTSMYRRATALKHGGYNMSDETKTALDFEMWCRMLCHGYLLSNIVEPLISYRINPTGVTKTKQQEMHAATDLIHSRFIRKNFKDPKLKASTFRQDIFKEIM